MRIAIAYGGTVSNVIEAETVEAAQSIFPGAEVFEADGVSIGWTFADGQWTAPAPAPEPTLAPLTRRQLRLGLLSIGITAEDVEAQITAITDPVDRAAALIEWEDATHYKRDHPLVADVAAAMQLPPEQVDALWVWAATM